MSSSRGSRTEKPTPQREKKAREKGQIARSKDLAGSLATAAGLLVAGSQAVVFVRAWRGFLGGTLAGHGAGTAGSLMPAAWLVLGSTGAIAGTAWIMALSGSLVQGGFVFAPTALQPKIGRFNPVGQLKRMVSVTALAHLGKSLVPLSVMLYFAVTLMARDWGQIQGMARMHASALTAFVTQRGYELAWKCALVMMAWSVVDYIAEYSRVRGELKMSKQEIMEEHKESEGHPAIKARIRRLQRQMRRRQMLKEAEHASVVITNPTHFAVALEYLPEMAAPTVVAKGQNKLALQIRQLALWQRIPLVENPPLAQALYRAVEVGQTIPPKLYAVVAEVLALVWQAEAQEQAREQAKNQARAQEQAQAQTQARSAPSQGASGSTL